MFGFSIELIVLGLVTVILFLLIGCMFGSLLLTQKTKSTIKSRVKRLREIPEELKSELGGVDAVEEEAKKSLLSGVDLKPMLSGITGDDYFNNLEQQLARADVPLRVSEFLVMRVIGTILIAVVTMYLLNNPLGLLIGLPAFFIHLPILHVLQQARISKFADQLADFLILIVNSLRAGQTFMQGCSVAVVESPNPISTEFKQVIKEVNLGMPEQESMENMLTRVPSEELKIVVSAYIIQRKVGGNLAEILDTTAETIRERIKIQGQISVLTTQGKLSGSLVGALPFVLGFILAGLNPQYMAPLISTIPGYVCIGIVVVLQSIGAFAIWRIVDIEI